MYVPNKNDNDLSSDSSIAIYAYALPLEETSDHSNLKRK